MRSELVLLAGLSALASLGSCKQEVRTMDKRELKEGTQAPDFTAATGEGNELSLRAFRARTVVLYFYPKDHTPGCTREACSFRDAQAELRQLGVAVLGVSRDDPKSHHGFAQKHSLNFPLLADPQGLIVAAYGVEKTPGIAGAPGQGTERSTFLIDGDGVIRRIWRNVRVDGHVDEVLAAVRELHGR